MTLTIMQTIEGDVFKRIKDRGSGKVFENFLLKKCLFDNCALSLTKDTASRSLARNVHAEQCRVFNSFVGPAIFEDVEIDGLSVNDLLILEGSLFKHVTLKGDIGKIKIITEPSVIDVTQEIQMEFDAQRKAYYDTIDWALDIHDARFLDFEISGIPSRLVRRDTETQVVVKRERIIDEAWKHNIAPWNSFWSLVIESKMDSTDDDFVLVAPKRSKKVKKLLDGLNNLRDIGVAEPD
jgi:hypothetical protein